MKKLFILFGLVFFAFNLFAQIKPFKFDGVKDYNNGHRIAYFYIEGINSENEAIYIQNNMVTLDEIYRFQFFAKKDNKNYVMVECDQNVDEKYIFDLMNQFYSIYEGSDCSKKISNKKKDINK